MSATKTHSEFHFRTATTLGSELLAGRPSLSATVQSAVRQVPDEVIRPISVHTRHSTKDGKRLLALLAWSYARELYSSAEIHSRLRRGWTAELWEDGVPAAEDIKRFRTENRRTLQTCLQLALRLMARQKVEEGFVTKFDESHIAAEASRRIVNAAFIDSMEDTCRATS